MTKMSLLVGLVFNSVAVLGLAAEGVDQVAIQGDVELQVQPLLSHRWVDHVFHSTRKTNGKTRDIHKFTKTIV